MSKSEFQAFASVANSGGLVKAINYKGGAKLSRKDFDDLKDFVTTKEMGAKGLAWIAFKDVGARFMSRCLGYFSKEKKASDRNSNLTKSTEDNTTKPTTVLVATSGDTGGAVANGFLGVEGVNVIILYPKGKVSPIQELQLTTCGQNITALEVEGSFDDCQAIVKEAFMDFDLNEQYNLTSANSINVARWLPQQLYYFFAWQQWVAKYQDLQGNYPPMNIVVPSGNFGNICAGMMAKASGLPLGHFVAACNANDVVTRYLSTEKYEIHKAIATVSNAMDVGDPSNFIRILQLFDLSRLVS
jgi:threonine synthase